MSKAPAPVFRYRATLLRVVDGDTFHCRIDLGMSISVDTVVRLAGINAPETSTTDGKTATTWAAEWFRVNAPDGHFIIETIKDRRDKYSRYLGVVLGPDSTSLNDALVASGQAAPYTP